MDHTVDRCFHAARSTCFKWLTRRVQPDVAPLDKEVRHVKVVVVHKSNASAESRIHCPLVDMLEMMLADVVRRMRLAGENDLHRIPGGIEAFRQPLRVSEYQLRSLEPRKSVRGADSQRYRVAQCPVGRHLNRTSIL